MLMAMPRLRNAVVNSSDVNCAPWSVLKISGRSWARSASCSASTQNVVSIEFDSLQDSTRREYQSITTTRYMKPVFIGTYVMSAAHTWLGRVTARFRSRYGYRGCSGAGVLVDGLGTSASMPISLISRWTRFLFTTWPLARKTSLILRLP